MLTRPFNARIKSRARQNGVVLMIALIVLVAMTLAGIALMRSVDTTNIIAGNLAFRQAATHASDKGIETAISWLTANNTGTFLEADHTPGYLSTRIAEPNSSQTWGDIWDSVLDSQATPLDNSNPDAGGNTVKYIIQRMCQNGGPATAAGCSFAPVGDCTNCSHGGGNSNPPLPAAQLYYRITIQTTGPRSTTSYIQSIVAL